MSHPSIRPSRFLPRPSSDQCQAKPLAEGRWRALSILAALPIAVGLSGTASAGQVQQIASFGNNPSGIGMYLYTPSNVTAKPPVLVGIHACHGKGTDVCSQGGGWVAQADKYGFLLICPSAVSTDGCWDVHSTADLTHNGGGDASGIISMVNYVVQNKKADAARVFAAGHSSGGMMTNVLLGSYPDVFKAGAAFAGVPFGCFAVGSVDSLGWNVSCATGNVTETGMQWGDTVRAAYPGFSGARPRMQLWHGTADAIVNFHNFGEEIKEWTDVLGVNATPGSTENNAIQAGWIRTRYPDASGVVQVEAIQETGQPHNLVVEPAEAVHFFGLDGTSPFPDAGAGEAGSDAQAVTGDSGAPGSGSDSGEGGSGAVASSGDAGGQGTGSGSSASSGSGPIGTSDEGGAGSGTASGGSPSASSGGSDASATTGTSRPGDSSTGSSNGCSIGRAQAKSAPALFSLLLVAGACARTQRRGRR